MVEWDEEEGRSGVDSYQKCRLMHHPSHHHHHHHHGQWCYREEKQHLSIWRPKQINGMLLLRMLKAKEGMHFLHWVNWAFLRKGPYSALLHPCIIIMPGTPHSSSHPQKWLFLPPTWTDVSSWRGEGGSVARFSLPTTPPQTAFSLSLRHYPQKTERNR